MLSTLSSLPVTSISSVSSGATSTMRPGDQLRVRCARHGRRRRRVDGQRHGGGRRPARRVRHARLRDRARGGRRQGARRAAARDGARAARGDRSRCRGRRRGGARQRPARSLVTGGGRGIGRAIALRFAEAGARVFVNFFVNREAAEKTARDVELAGGAAHLVQADVKEPAEIRRMFAEIARRPPAPRRAREQRRLRRAEERARRSPPKHWDWVMATNARPLLLCAQEAAKLMSGGRPDHRPVEPRQPSRDSRLRRRRRLEGGGGGGDALPRCRARAARHHREHRVRGRDRDRHLARDSRRRAPARGRRGAVRPSGALVTAEAVAESSSSWRAPRRSRSRGRSSSPTAATRCWRERT